ncbi:alkyl hydroperoxide reductase [Candidatus Roizmanbacteria bacterium RIFCSPHIGHO2_12_FULL_39_8]|uniref:Alkyl hydroperoxide reductase n=1 Tax=Candidatus Roizmanbacteria bacterium RIFCSPHIGHO2_12_FULL_39_8 TaxID=1802050 RepID=A0A1F7I2W8_9BACT|nr:MAG: alkyl hydroperoxide reductase [Candidatus Roizmanbacteria bacterium RIFCSPHIGHO2_12_FULL_39_8]
MVLTPSTMLPLGTKAPDFRLEDVTTGKSITLETFKDAKVLLVMFICRHCPYVQHIKEELAKIDRDYKDKIGSIAISANDAEEYPDDAPESLKLFAKEMNYSFPFCYDATQEVAKSYTAACTPDFFLFDADKKLVYRGELDASRPSTNIPVTGKDLRAAIDAVLTNEPVNRNQKPSVGCNIKWRTGNEPSYFIHTV